jgi:hypothetical protein
MHRTQIYFEESMLQELKKQANILGITLSAYIRQVLEINLLKTKQGITRLDFSEYAGMWENRKISQLSIRKDAWK